MHIFAHVENHSDYLTVGFGTFVVMETDDDGTKCVDASDLDHYCYFYLNEKEIDSLFSKDDADKIKALKHREQLILTVTLQSLPTEQAIKLIEGKEVFNGQVEEPDEDA